MPRILFLKRKGIYILLLCLLSLHTLTYYFHFLTPNPRVLPDSETLLLEFKDSENDLFYKSFYDNYGEEFFKSKNLLNQCILYFDHLLSSNENWNSLYINDININDLPHDAGVFNKKNYMNRLKGNNKELSKEELSKLEKDYNLMKNSTLKTEDYLINIMSHMRVFNKCYIENNLETINKQEDNFSINTTEDSVTLKYYNKFANFILKLFKKFKIKLDELVYDFHEFDEKLVKRDNSNKYEENCQLIEPKLFPWINFDKKPEFKRWDGETLNDYPIMKNYYNYPFNDLPKTVTNNIDCFITKFQKKINGRGIVLSINDSHVKDVVSLIKLLRVLNNFLPIQIIHKGDLSLKNQDLLIEISRKDIEDKEVELIEKFNDYLISYSDLTKVTFPKQELWFVNVNQSITSGFEKYFENYSNKYLSIIFNSFQEIILMDGDSIPLINPNDFFHSKKFKDSGTFFFKDRLAKDFLVPEDTKLFKKILPSQYDFLFFKVDNVLTKTFETRFFEKNFKHLMESGIMIFSRDLHFLSSFTAVQINLWNKLLGEKIWGDKESYWLGMAVLGDEDFEFNENGSAGIITSNTTIIKTEDFLQINACSVQPGHVNDETNLNLLWFNSGFKICKKSKAFEMDSSLVKYQKMFHEEDKSKLSPILKKYYNEPIEVHGLVIPTDYETDLTNSKKGWRMITECLGFKHCANDIFFPHQVEFDFKKVEKTGNNEKIFQDQAEYFPINEEFKFNSNGITLRINDEGGKFIEYSEERKKIYEFFGEVWKLGYDIEINNDTDAW